MNAPARIPAAQPYARHTFKVWSLALGSTKSVRIRLDFADLGAVERHIASAGYHGETIFVLEDDTIEHRKTLHQYAIQRGKWQGRFDPTTGKQAYPYTAKKLSAMRVVDFVPLEPWEWAPGCDVLGHAIDVLGARS